MELPSFIDEDVIYNPIYWLLTAGAELALMVGFKAQKYWGAGTIPFWNMILILILLPLMSYLVVKKMMR